MRFRFLLTRWPSRFQKFPAIQHQLTRRNRRHVAVVRDHQHRDVEFLVEPLQEHLNLLAGFRVETAGRFIGDDDFRMSHNGASNADSLLLTAGQLPRVVIGSIGQPDRFQRQLDSLRRCDEDSLSNSVGNSTFSYAVSTGIRLCV